MQNLVTSLHKTVRRTPRPFICENQRSFTLEERYSNEFSSSRQYHGRPGQARTRYRRACHPCGFDHDAQPPPPLLRFALYPPFPIPHPYLHAPAASVPACRGRGWASLRFWPPAPEPIASPGYNQMISTVEPRPLLLTQTSLIHIWLAVCSIHHSSLIRIHDIKTKRTQRQESPCILVASAATAQCYTVRIDDMLVLWAKYTKAYTWVVQMSARAHLLHFVIVNWLDKSLVHYDSNRKGAMCVFSDPQLRSPRSPVSKPSVHFVLPTSIDASIHRKELGNWSSTE